MARKLKVGDWVKVVKIPPHLGDSAEIDTPGVFRRALNKAFRIEGFGKYGHIELVVEERHPTDGTYESDTIWIEPDFVEFVGDQSTNELADADRRADANFQLLDALEAQDDAHQN